MTAARENQSKKYAEDDSFKYKNKLEKQMATADLQQQQMDIKAQGNIFFWKYETYQRSLHEIRHDDDLTKSRMKKKMKEGT